MKEIFFLSDFKVHAKTKCSGDGITKAFITVGKILREGILAWNTSVSGSVLDAFRGYLTKSVETRVKDMYTHLVIIPGNGTLHWQVNINVNKLCKDALKTKTISCYGDHK